MAKASAQTETARLRHQVTFRVELAYLRGTSWPTFRTKGPARLDQYRGGDRRSPVDGSHSSSQLAFKSDKVVVPLDHER